MTMRAHSVGRAYVSCTLVAAPSMGDLWRLVESRWPLSDPRVADDFANLHAESARLAIVERAQHRARKYAARMVGWR